MLKTFKAFGELLIYLTFWFILIGSFLNLSI